MLEGPRIAAELGNPLTQVARALVRALRDGRSLSLVRLGDGETLTLRCGLTDGQRQRKLLTLME